MTTNRRGGNSRTLAKALDEFVGPIAILDRKGQVVFVNAALCEMARCEATQLVGRQCIWNVAGDTEPLGPILNLLAPPQAARDGQITTRCIERSSHPQEDAFQSGVGSGNFDTQMFVPILDEDNLPHLTLVIHGVDESITQQVCASTQRPPDATSDHEKTLALIRSRWTHLDDLTALIGDSPSVLLAMTRAQLSIRQPCNLLICGPAGVGKREIARGIFKARLSFHNVPPAAGQCFSIDAAMDETQLLDGMLELFVGRMRSPEQPDVQLLILENLQQLSDGGLEKLLRFLDRHGEACRVIGLCDCSADDLENRGDGWQALIAKLAQIEINLPALNARREDIPVVAQESLSQSCRAADRALLSFTSESLDLLTAHSWPQNVQQVRSAVAYAVEQAVLTDRIEPHHLPVEVRTFPSTSVTGDGIEPISLDDVLEECERTVIQRALERCPRNRAQVARMLGISRARLLRRIEQLGLSDGADDTDSPHE